MICQPHDSSVLASEHRWLFDPYGELFLRKKLKLFEGFAVPEIQFYRTFDNIVTFNII